jgi:hypothetical protein
MPLVTYEQTRPWAAAMAHSVQMKMMPPWFADPRYGHFANDASLTPQQIATIVAWPEAGAPAGDVHDAPPPRQWPQGWNIPQPDLVVKMPRAVKIPAQGEVEYTYEIVPTHFAEDRWVQMSEFRPGSPAHVHHAVVYIRPAGFAVAAARARRREPFTASTLNDPLERREAHETTSDLLLVYAPGSSPGPVARRYGEIRSRGIRSGISDALHDERHRRSGSDQHRAGVRQDSAQAESDHAAVEQSRTHHSAGRGRLSRGGAGHAAQRRDLLSLFPHMHLRGKRFEYDIVHDDGSVEVLLRVNYHFHWQLSYRLAEPRLLKAGTRLRAIAWYDNSKNNPHNPDPEKTVTWGDQTSDEMMVGFFDVAVAAGMDKWKFFVRQGDLKHEQK